ncbi:DUF5133 domain-containing protein [Streptomyces sp. NPDC058279]|uniref:DUF5133 domain-containing protein n=1 Tax=Streptomyces sp. NPDC058279 TaxID=3346418 RepID=UPI0036EFD3B4
MTSQDSVRPQPTPAARPAVARTVEAPAVGRALGVLMASVPCDSRTARRILTDAATTAGSTVEEAAGGATAALHGDGPRPPAAIESAVRAAIDRSLSVDRPTSSSLLPNPHVLRRHLARFRDLRRRTFTAPDDPALRAGYDDAAYTLCVLLGRRHVHHALTAAEQLIAAHRLAGPEPADLPHS